MRAHFEIEHTLTDILVIRDVGPWDQHPSVTNDAEAVVQHLLQTGELRPGERLLYYDSEGDLSELLIENGAFAGFKAISRYERGAAR